MTRGKVVSFDRVKGYGFLAPEEGGEDVFIHVNDLYGDKSLLGPGSIVEFRLEEGDRGPKASAVTVIQSPAELVPTGPARPPVAMPAAPSPIDAASAKGGEDVCDVLSAAEFESEVTEALLRVVPDLTSGQILEIRKRLLLLAQAHNWSDR